MRATYSTCFRLYWRAGLVGAIKVDDDDTSDSANVGAAPAIQTAGPAVQTV